MKTKLKLLAISHLMSAICFSAHAQGAAFTYQGRLNDGANPANGKYDFVFAIYGSPTGTLDGFANQTNPATPVSNGLFTVTLDLAQPGIFTGPDRWLDIAVRTNGNGAYATLAPRQKLTPTPYAITAGNVVSNGLAAGTYGSAVTFNNAGNSFSGNGSGLANVNALTLGGIGSSGFWQTAGNSGTTAGPNYLGTADNQALEIHVNGVRALRIEPASGAPNLIGGYYQNNAGSYHSVAIAGGGTSASLNQAVGDYAFIGAGHGAQAGSFSAVVDGAYNVAPGQFSFIGSGLRQTNLADFSFIGSGTNNLIGVSSDSSAIGGGTLNVIQTNSIDATISGGLQNNIGANAGAATIAGGSVNTIETGAGSSSIGGGDENLIQSGSTYSVIAGGHDNTIQTNAVYSTIGGGIQNTIQSGAFVSTIGGGQDNTIQPYAYYSTIGGGQDNTIQTNVVYSTIGGGIQNTIQNSADYATIPGGFNNLAAGTLSFAAGTLAHALHQGAFVWADSQNAVFSSTANDQFLVRAAGGVGINTANPMGNALSVNGDTRLDAQALGYNEGLALNFPTNMSGSGGYGGIHFHSTAQNGAFGAGSIKWGMFYNYTPENGIAGNGLSFAQNNTTTRLYISTNGNVGIGTTSPSQKLNVNGNILASGTITGSSDRNVKEHFTSVNARDVLAKVSALPITEWNYIADGETLRHVGPMAQDFYAAFNVGLDDKHISMVDADGVALAAIQGLNEKLEARSQKLEQENTELKQRLDALEKIIRNRTSN